MNATAIFDLAKRLSGQQLSSLYTPSYLLPYLNIVRHHVENKITGLVRGGLLLSDFSIPTVINQQIYTLDADIKSFDIVSLNLSSGITILEELDLQNIKAENEQGYYYIKGNTITITTPIKEAVAGGIVITGGTNLTDLATGASESDIKINTQYHHILSLGIVPYIYREERQIDMAQEADKNYRDHLDEMINDIRANRQKVVYQTLPPVTLD